MDDILTRSYRDGVLGPDARWRRPTNPKVPDGFVDLRREMMFVSLMAWEYADPRGPLAGDERIADVLLPALERLGGQFPGDDSLTDKAGPGPFFVLTSFTRALCCLRGKVDPAWHARRVAEGATLFASAVRIQHRTHEYLNARALEMATCYNLYRLTGRQEYLDRCTECLDQLITRQYPCGALPYHTGTWYWGRRPAQVYQLLCASLMLFVSRELGRQDGIDYVRRVVEFTQLATSRFGEAFVTPYEGLHKAASRACAGRQWVTAAGLGDEQFRGFACKAYEVYIEGLLDDPFHRHESFRHEALTEALEMGIGAAPAPVAMKPTSGVHALEDISTVIVHEGEVELAMTLLTGYSAFAEGAFGNVKLFALTPELTAEPNYSNCGTDALRPDWQKPTEQIACESAGERALLSGWVYTKWERSRGKDSRFVHNRRLGVTMTCEAGELVLEFETLKHWNPAPVPARLLLLLSARPFDQSGRLTLDGRHYATPPAEADESFYAEAPVGAVRFVAPDGSALEIIPELSLAEKITAERPPKGSPLPANEGCLRLAFDGPNVLDRGRYRLRYVR